MTTAGKVGLAIVTIIAVLFVVWLGALIVLGQQAKQEYEAIRAMQEDVDGIPE